MKKITKKTKPNENKPASNLLVKVEKKAFQIRIPEELQAELSDISDVFEISQNNFIEAAIRFYIEALKEEHL